VHISSRATSGSAGAQLLRLYGEMNDGAKQELLLFAEDLHREASPGCPERE
jgi:hypothetical protein